MSASPTIRAILCIVEQIPDAVEDDWTIAPSDIGLLEARLSRACIALGRIQRRRLKELAAHYRADPQYPQGPEEAA